MSDYFNYLKSNISLEDVCNLLGMSVIKKGTEKKTLCPFHNDHDPSMVLYTDTHAYHCFACNAHGDIFSIIRKQLNCDFSDSIKWLEINFPHIVRETEKFNVKRLKPTKKSGFQLALECYQNMTSQERQNFDAFAVKRGYSSDFLLKHEIFYVSANKRKRKIENTCTSRTNWGISF